MRHVINPFDLAVSGDIIGVALVLFVAMVAIAAVAVSARELVRDRRRHHRA